MRSFPSRLHPTWKLFKPTRLSGSTKPEPPFPLDGLSLAFDLFMTGGTSFKARVAAVGRAVMGSSHDKPLVAPPGPLREEVLVSRGTPDDELQPAGENPASRALLLLDQEETRLEAELLKVKERKALEQRWIRSLAAQGEVEQRALKAFDVDDEDACDNMIQEGLELGTEGFESDEYESEAEDKDSEKPRVIEDSKCQDPEDDRLRVEDLWQEVGLADSNEARKQGMQFVCKDGVGFPACPALVAAATAELAALIALHIEEANSNPEVVAHEIISIPLPDLSSAGLLYILHCLQFEDDLGEVYCKLSLELCFELLSAASALFNMKFRWQSESEFDKAVLVSTFMAYPNDATLVGYLSAVRSFNPAKPEIRERIVEYLQWELEGPLPGGTSILDWSLLKQLCWDDFKMVRVDKDKSIRYARNGTAGPSSMMSAWSTVLKNRQYACSWRLYYLVRDILIWAAWQLSEDAVQAMKIHLPMFQDYSTAYSCYDVIELDGSGDESEDEEDEESARHKHIKNFTQPLPEVLSELSQSGALKAVLCGWNWPWGTLETIHPEVLLFKLKPLGVIEECRLKRALRWQAGPHPKHLISIEGGRAESQFSVYLYNVLHEVHPGITVSLDAMAQVNCFLQAVLEKLSLEAARIARANKQSTISWKNIERAVMLLLPRSLARGAVGAGTEAYDKCYAVT